jgi:hypothetical protein
MLTYLSPWTADPEADEQIAGVPIPRQSNRRARSRSLAFQSNSSARERMANRWTLSRGFSYHCKLFEMDTNSGRAIIAGPFSNRFRAKARFTEGLAIRFSSACARGDYHLDDAFLDLPRY